MFGALMAIGRLSGDGEVEAMRAGGVSFVRLAAPVLAAGLLISVLALVLNEMVVPPANAASQQLLEQLAHGKIARQDYLVVQLPDNQRPKIWLYADYFDAATGELRDVWIAEFRAGKFWDYYEAPTAVWQGTIIVMSDVLHRSYNSDGARFEERLVKVRYPLGMAPWQVKGVRKKPEDMTIAELGRDIARLGQLPVAARKRLPELIEYFHIRLATPWSALGFALIALPLGLRPKRTTTGVGLGISLAIILAYYIAFNTLRVVGEQGALPPALAAWLPNLLLYGVGLGLLVDASR